MIFKKILLTALLVCAGAGFALAGYDVSNRPLGDVTVIEGSSLSSTDQIMIYNTADKEAELIPALDLFGSFEDVTATNILTTAECGKAMTLNSATEFVTTLPLPSAGCKFDFYIKAAPSGANYTIVTSAGADIMVVLMSELEVDTNDDGVYDINADVVTFIQAVSVEGDYMKCNSDGTKWYCNGTVNADGAVTTGTS